MGFFDKIINAAEMTGRAVGQAKQKYDEYQAKQAQRYAQMNQPLFSERPATGLALAIGVTTGELYARGHQIGLAGNQWVWLKNDDCCQNIVVMGGIGSGDVFAVLG